MKLLEWLAEHGTIIGAAGIVVFVALEFEHRLSKRMHSWLFGINLGLTISAFLLGSLKDHLDEKWQNRVNEQITDSNIRSQESAQKIVTTVKRADELEHHAVLLKLEADKAKLEIQNLALELINAKEKAEQTRKLADEAASKLRPRTITPEQKANFKEYLKSTQKGKVRVASVVISPEANDYATAICDLLTETGFIVIIEKNGQFELPAFTGLRIQIPDEKIQPSHAARLQRAFGMIGPVPSGAILPELEKDVVRLSIGQKAE